MALSKKKSDPISDKARALTDRMVEALHQDADALGIERPSFEPRAMDYVPQMLSMIGALENNGLAYRASNGDVNYAVRKFADYGKLSGKSLDELQAGERVAVDEGNFPLKNSDLLTGRSAARTVTVGDSRPLLFPLDIEASPSQMC